MLCRQGGRVEGGRGLLVIMYAAVRRSSTSKPYKAGTVHTGSTTDQANVWEGVVRIAACVQGKPSDIWKITDRPIDRSTGRLIFHVEKKGRGRENIPLMIPNVMEYYAQCNYPQQNSAFVVKTSTIGYCGGRLQQLSSSSRERQSTPQRGTGNCAGKMYMTEDNIAAACLRKPSTRRKM